MPSTRNVEGGARQILMHGLAFILVGLLWGFAIPIAPYPRLALGAHIQFELSGMLFLILAILLLKLDHQVGPKSVMIMLITVYLTWLMAFSEAANGWWGTNQMLPIAAQQAGATGGQPWQELAVMLTHIFAALGLILSWTMLIIGFAKDRRNSPHAE